MAGIQKFRKQIITPDDSPHEALNRVQDSVKATTDAIVANPVIQGQLLVGLKFAPNVSTAVNHKLGRKITGWHVSRTQSYSVSLTSLVNNNSVTTQIPAQVMFSEDRSRETTTTIYITANSDALSSPGDPQVTTDLYVY